MILSYEHNGKPHDITLPASVAEVTYCQFLDWRSPITAFVQKEVKQQEKEAEKEMPENVTKDNFHQLAAIHQAQMEKDQQVKQLSEPEYLLNSFKMFLTMIQLGAHLERPEMLEVLNKSIAAIIPEPLNDIPITTPDDDLSDLLQNGVDWMDGQDLSLCRLTCYLCNLFRNYISIIPPIGQNYSCEYKGETYYVQPEKLLRLEGINLPTVGHAHRKFTTDEVNEFTEYQRIFDKKIETKGDPDGALEFQMNLTQLAILLRKDGERLPSARNERRQWIHQRSAHFKDLPMSIVYEVRTFFLRTLRHSLLNLISQRILEKPLPSPTLQGITARQAARQRSGRRKRPKLSMKR